MLFYNSFIETTFCSFWSEFCFGIHKISLRRNFGLHCMFASFLKKKKKRIKYKAR